MKYEMHQALEDYHAPAELEKTGGKDQVAAKLPDVVKHQIVIATAERC
jgi:hypothetical protein